MIIILYHQSIDIVGTATRNNFLGPCSEPYLISQHTKCLVSEVSECLFKRCEVRSLAMTFAGLVYVIAHSRSGQILLVDINRQLNDLRHISIIEDFL